ncbi:MFS transporter [uncultured Aquabacterium sp.]|uniref:MFS transporter n=1 Tax=Aquabacterium sp. TaxID=1872578 RepID=UPI0025DED55F|nr:MFS transporter [uncultured Aquabacterium sp.]
MNAAPILPHAASARYGLLGMPLAFVAVPLYVVLPQHYGQTLGVPLGLLGAVLLLTRLGDAVIDPWLGGRVDRLLGQPARVRVAVALCAVLLVLAFVALFFPPVRGTHALLGWCAVTLVFTFGAYSLASVAHLAWGTRLGGAPLQRARLVAWREGFALVGVLLANVLATQAGPGWTAAVLALTLVLGVLALWRGPSPGADASFVQDRAVASASESSTLWRPWRGEGFRRLMTLFLLNGIASAVPATLVLFFIHDRLQAPEWAPLCLGAYFLMAALSVPWWLRVLARKGPMRAWALGMGLATAAFAGVNLLGPGDTAPYLVVCLAAGWALGADLTAPGTLLTGVVQRSGEAGQAEGAFAGWWQWATKLNLALAAGVALPLLEALGYTPGARDAEALLALGLVYGGLPCLFKLMALALCWRWRRHPALA